MKKRGQLNIHTLTFHKLTFCSFCFFVFFFYLAHNFQTLVLQHGKEKIGLRNF